MEDIITCDLCGMSLDEENTVRSGAFTFCSSEHRDKYIAERKDDFFQARPAREEIGR